MQDPIYSRIESTPRPTLFAASGFVWLAAAGLWITELALMLLQGVLPQGVALENALYYLPFVALPMFFYMRFRPGLGEGMRLNPVPLPPMLSVVVLSVLTVYAASLLSYAWGLGLDALGLRQIGAFDAPRTEEVLVLYILSQAAMPAVCEELLFRGFVLSAWESRGTWLAVGVSAGLFALLHGNLYGMPAYLLVGGVAGFVTFVLDSVYAGMVYHTVYNATCLILPWLMGSTDAAAKASASPSPFTMVLQALTIFSLMAMLLATLRARAHSRGIVPIPRIRRPLEGRDRGMLAGAVITMAATMVVILAMSARMGGAT